MRLLVFRSDQAEREHRKRRPGEYGWRSKIRVKYHIDQKSN